MEPNNGPALRIDFGTPAAPCTITSTAGNDLPAGRDLSVIRMSRNGPVVVFRAISEEFARKPVSTMTRFLLALGQSSAPCTRESGGWHFRLADGGSLSAWPDVLLFRDPEGNESGAAFFARQLIEEPEEVLSAIVVALGSRCPSNLAEALKSMEEPAPAVAA